jgi:chitinase
MLAFFNSLSCTRGAKVLAAMLVVGLAPIPAWAEQAQPPRPVVAYVDTTGKNLNLDGLPWGSITHINVAFAGIDMRGNCAMMDPSGKDAADGSGHVPKIIQKLVAERNAHNPQVKLLLSVGGWTMSYRFSHATQTEEGTERLARTCVNMVNDLGLDGLDYDWEYPTKLGKGNCPQGLDCATRNDPQQLVALLKASRQALGDDTVNKPLSVAVYMTPGSRGIPYDVAGMDPYLTFWNIMAYDAAAPNWSEGTAFHAAISASQNSLWDYAQAGATPSKLNLGVPYYGYIWWNVPTAAVGVAGRGNQNNWSQYSTFDIYGRLGTDTGCKLYTQADGDFFYCNSGAHAGEWAAVDSPRVLITKASFVRDNNFGGIMMWAVQTDTPTGDLTKLVASVLKGKSN